MRLSLIVETLGTPLPGEERKIRAMNTLADASANELSYLSDNRYLNSLETTKTAALLVKANAVDAVAEHCIALVCEDASLSMAKATSLFTPPLIDHDAAKPFIGKKSFIDPRANIEKGAVIGKGVTVMAGAYVGSGAVIGDDTVIFPNVTIYRDCRIGARCRIHGGTKSIKESGKIFSGYPLMEHRLWSQPQSRLSKLAKEGTSTKKRAKTHEVE